MALLPANTVMTLTSVTPQADGTIVLTFSAGPDAPNQWYPITLTLADIAATTTGAQLRALVQAKLNAMHRPAAALLTALQGFIGQTVTV